MFRLTLILLIMVHTVIKAGNDNNQSAKYYLYVGSYTQSEDEGIYVYEFDAKNGNLKYLHTVAGVENPSYLAIQPDKNLLIAVNETMEYHGEKTGAVSAFSVDPASGNLKLINQVPSGGGAPCYVSIDSKGKYVLVANYMSGTVTMFQIATGGRLSAYTDLQQHKGSGPVSKRQKGPHAHTIILDNNEKFALAADLGTDEVIGYEIDKRENKLRKASAFKVKAGSGPRHIAFHPGGRYVYVISELANTVTACTYDPQTGKLTEIMTASTLPDDFNGTSYCADIHFSKDGRFLYGSNRGHDSIVIFNVDGKTGKISYVDHFSVNGEWPRNFMIDPTGNYLLVANQNSGNIVVFRLDKNTGKATETNNEVKVSKPVCLKMLPMP